MADSKLFGDYPNQVCTGTVNDPSHKTSYELDVVVFGLTDDNRSPLLAIGEAKWGEVMGLSHVTRLRRIRDLLSRQNRNGASTAKLVCYSGVGFSPELVAAVKETSEIVLVALPDLYTLP